MIGVRVGVQYGTAKFDADYQKVLAQATNRGYAFPTAAHLILQNLFVKELKEKGIWEELDLLYVFAVSTTDNSNDFTRINFKKPENFELTLESAPSWTADQGWSNSGTSRLATGFTLDNSSHAENYTRDDAGGFAAFPIMNSASQTNSRIYGNAGTSNYLSPRLQVDGDNSGNRNWINDTQYQEMDIHKDNNTIFFQNRTSSSTINYRSTDLAAADTKSGEKSSGVDSNAVVNEELKLLGSRSGDHMAAGNTMGLFGFGGSLTSTKMAALETAWYTNYFTKL